MVIRQENENAMDYVRRGIKEEKEEKEKKGRPENVIKTYDEILEYLEDDYLFLKISPKTAHKIFSMFHTTSEDAIKAYKELISKEQIYEYRRQQQMPPIQITMAKTLIGRFTKKLFKKKERENEQEAESNIVPNEENTNDEIEL